MAAAGETPHDVADLQGGYEPAVRFETASIRRPPQAVGQVRGAREEGVLRARRDAQTKGQGRRNRGGKEHAHARNTHAAPGTSDGGKHERIEGRVARERSETI